MNRPLIMPEIKLIGDYTVKLVMVGGVLVISHEFIEFMMKSNPELAVIALLVYLAKH